ncbi:MAG TPA: WecB/TagA/CpsF family glycosyltransferase [Candidatus Dormibacteraeota bacterium]|nr:WecB/TagA/CpsF family glycosyltransferase [Candidatus Dormibacteraeota bacterium]
MSQSPDGAVPFAARIDPNAAEMVRRVISRVGAYREAELVEDCARAMATPGTQTAFGVHIGDINQSLVDLDYIDALGRGTYLYADGTSVRVVAAAFGRRLPERLVTTDVIWPVLERAAAGDHPVFLLGGPEGLAEKAADRMRARIPGLRIAGCAHGFFSPAEAPAVAARIRETGAHLVIVATGVPHQQRFCRDVGSQTGARLLLTAGGLYGYMAGRESRAPARMRAAGFEWLWRVAQDPRRLAGRYARGCLSCARLTWAALLLRGK